MSRHGEAAVDSTRGWHSPAEWLRWFGRTTKRLLVLTLGVAIVGAGVAMLVLPGPGLLIVIVGLAVLATEFMWAERALDRATTEAATAANRVAASRRGRLALIASGLGMITGGAIVAATVDTYRIIGLSVAMAGVIGLGTLLPPVQRWLETKTSATTRASTGGPIPVAAPAVASTSVAPPSHSSSTPPTGATR